MVPRRISVVSGPFWGHRSVDSAVTHAAGEMEDLAQRLTEATEAFAAAKRKLRQLQRAKAQKKEDRGVHRRVML